MNDHFYAIQVAALGRTYGLTPDEIDKVWASMRSMIPAMKPSQALGDFEEAARRAGVPLVSATPAAPARPFDPAAERLRMAELRHQIGGLAGEPE